MFPVDFAITNENKLFVSESETRLTFTARRQTKHVHPADELLHEHSEMQL